MIFVEAPESVDELRRIGAEVPGPLMANMVEGGRTPILELRELRQLGFEWVVYPLSGLLSAARALERAFGELAAHGVSRPDPSSQLSFEEFTEIVGLDHQAALFRPHALASDVIVRFGIARRDQCDQCGGSSSRLP